MMKEAGTGHSDPSVLEATMSILDWFKNRADQFDPDRISDDLIELALSKAIALTNPRLKLVRNHKQRLTPSVITTIRFLQGLVKVFPVARPLSEKTWPSDPVLRAFFVSPPDVGLVLSRSDNLRDLFTASPELDRAYAILGMAYSEQRTFGMALQGGIVARDVAQTTVNFADHKTRLCGKDEPTLRRIVGVEVFDHLISRALSEIGTERNERQELQIARSLIRARLNLLRQHGPGLGSMLGDAPATASDQERLQSELLENERQLEALGGGESLLESEFTSLKEVLDRPQDYLSIAPMHLRLNPMNIVLDESSTDTGAGIDFAVIELKGAAPIRRAFIVTLVDREEIPPPQKLNLQGMARYL